MEASEAKWVNSIWNIIWGNSLRRGGLHCIKSITVKFEQVNLTVWFNFSNFTFKCKIKATWSDVVWYYTHTSHCVVEFHFSLWNKYKELRWLQDIIYFVWFPLIFIEYLIDRWLNCFEKTNYYFFCSIKKSLTFWLLSYQYFFFNFQAQKNENYNESQYYLKNKRYFVKIPIYTGRK